ncbi:PspA/IM30 family protein [Pseudomonas syringae pv. actinidiae]|nr:PspA/IM30 family protein [Pseudomonas syringae pv. actinidiae]
MLKNLWNIVRAWFRIGGEAVVDSQRIILMEQGIVNANAKIRESEASLIAVKTDRKLQEQKAESLTQKIAEYTKHLTTLAGKGEGQGDLAKKIAAEYASVQNDLNKLNETIAQQTKAERQIEADIKKARQFVNDAERNGNTIKATDSLIKAKAAVSSSTSGINSELSDAMEHQAKLQQKQSEELARLDAANEYEDQKNGQSFNRELQEAGLVSGGVSADDILAQFANVEKTAPQA